VIIGGVIFGVFAGYSFWFPKAFGFRLHEGWGKAAFWFTLVGFWAVFAPLYMAGLLGMTRRLQHFDFAPWQPWILAAGAGMILSTIGAACQVIQLIYSIIHRDQLRDYTGDPWDGRSLEWATTSPPPVFNFAVLPDVHGEEAYWGLKQRARELGQLSPDPEYQPIHMPRNSPTGFICAFFATLIGFALIWHIWWLAILGLVGAYATFVVFAWRDVKEYWIPAEEVARLDRLNRSTRHEAITRTGMAPL
jgi:cytochrome o ubiquinol oxidase subunit 1